MLLELLFVHQQQLHQHVTLDISYIKLESALHVLLSLTLDHFNQPIKLLVALMLVQLPVVSDMLLFKPLVQLVHLPPLLVLLDVQPTDFTL